MPEGRGRYIPVKNQRKNHIGKADFIVIVAIQEAKYENILYKGMIHCQFMNGRFDYMNGSFEYMNGSMAGMNRRI